MDTGVASFQSVSSASPGHGLACAATTPAMDDLWGKASPSGRRRGF